jgi:hypothetical protein
MKEAAADTCYMLVSCLPYSATLKIEAICSSETSVDFQRTAWRYTPEDSTLHCLRCEVFISGSGNCLFRRFRPFFAFETIHNNVRLRINAAREAAHGKNGSCGGNMEIIDINEICKMSVGVYFVSEGKNTEPPCVTDNQLVTGGHVPLSVV